MFYSSLMLSGKCIADAEFTEPALKKEISDKLWSLYKAEEYSLFSDSALDVLSLVKPRHIIDTLINQLKNKDRDARGSAAFDLGALCSAEALPALLKALNTDKDRSVRWRAAEAVGKIGDETAVHPLKKALEDEHFFVSIAASEALEKIRKRVGEEKFEVN